jgi:hypothetical protein
MVDMSQNILRRAQAHKLSAKQANDWLRRMVRNISSPSAQKLIDNADPFKRIENLVQNSIGKMYLFKYDPKGKDTLPYYDTYPLIFPIEYYGDSMLGINLHYLPPILRAKLMDALYSTINNEKFDKTTKLKISYSILSAASRYSYFKPCIKKYLYSHVRSSFLYIAPDEWDVVCMLPLQRFVGAGTDTVWRDSGKIAGS